METRGRLGDVLLQTQRLELREFELSDQDAVQEYAGDPAVTRWTSWGPNTPEMTRSVLRMWSEERKRRPRVEWPMAVVRRDDGVLVGGTGLTHVNWESGEAEFGYVLRRSAWKCGFATEAGREVVRWALDELGLKRLIAHCSPENAASLRVLEKLGFRGQEGEEEFQKANGEKLTFARFAKQAMA